MQIIGVRGTVIKSIRVQSGASVDIERHESIGAPATERWVHLSGSAQQVEEAETLIWHHIQSEDAEEAAEPVVAKAIVSAPLRIRVRRVEKPGAASEASSTPAANGGHARDVQAAHSGIAAGGGGANEDEASPKGARGQRRGGRAAPAGVDSTSGDSAAGDSSAASDALAEPTGSVGLAAAGVEAATEAADGGGVELAEAAVASRGGRAAGTAPYAEARAPGEEAPTTAPLKACVSVRRGSRQPAGMASTAASVVAGTAAAADIGATADPDAMSARARAGIEGSRRRGGRTPRESSEAAARRLAAAAAVEELGALRERCAALEREREQRERDFAALEARLAAAEQELRALGLREVGEAPAATEAAAEAEAAAAGVEEGGVPPEAEG